MLNSIRKFSSTIFAKVLLIIIIIPFVTWGMGDFFSSGTKNTIATINKEKVSTQNFVNHLNSLNLDIDSLKDDSSLNILEEILSGYISQIILRQESENLGIDISEKSLAKLIKNEKIFMSENNFSRVKYEKFLIESNMNAVQFETRLREQEKKRMLFDFISSGIKSPEFLVNKIYDYQNQTRIVEFIDLNKIYENTMNFTDNDIKNYYEKNKEKFIENYRSIKYLNINPQQLVGENSFNSLFFKKLDAIEDEIANSNNITFISQKFNLKTKSTGLFNLNGRNIKGDEEIDFKNEIINEIFKIEKNESPVVLININDDYLVVELINVENISSSINSSKTKKSIIKQLGKDFITNENKNLNKKIKNKLDFNNFAKENNTEVKIAEINNLNDYKKFNKDIVNKIYKLPKNKFGLLSDKSLNENLLVYVNKINNKTINKNDENFTNFLYQSNAKLKNDIYATYDLYINKKYKVDINYQTLERIKNYYK